MATAPQNETLNIEEQLARIAKMRVETDKAIEETRKIMRETNKTSEETRKIIRETDIMPRAMIFQAMIATAALLGAGAAIAKLFFP